MKTIFLVALVSTLSCFASRAEDAPTFIKVGTAYVITAGPGVAVSRVVTIAAAGGGGWFRVTTPKDTATGQQRAEDMGDKWINFNQLIEVREALVKKGGK